MMNIPFASEVVRTFLAYEGYTTAVRSFEGRWSDRWSDRHVDFVKQCNVTIAKACYAERVLADDGDWYANQARKLPWQWAIEGGV